MRVLLLTFALAACATAKAEAPPAPRAYYIEIVGNYHGRQLQLDVNGATVAQGYQHLLPPGVAWREELPPTGDVALTINIEPCEAPFTQTFTPGAEAPTLIIDSCDIRLVGAN